MSTIKKSRPANFAQDMRDLDNIANAYNNCSDGFKQTWKQKWYEMCSVIAKRVQEYRENVDRKGR
jgi:hypothetical protein